MAAKKPTRKPDKAKQKVELIDNAGQAWKLYSVWFAMAIPVITAANEWMPGLKGLMSPGVYAGVVSVLGVIVIVARIVKQNTPAA